MFIDRKYPYSLVLLTKLLKFFHMYTGGSKPTLSWGLGDSCGGKWSRDVDLNDGSLLELFEEYTCRLDELGLARMDHQIETDLALLETNLKDDLCNGKYMCLCEIRMWSYWNTIVL